MIETLMGRMGYEKRETASCTDSVVAAILNGARGSVAEATATSALEASSGLVNGGVEIERALGMSGLLVTDDPI